MLNLINMTEVMRRHGLGDSPSKISAALKVPESTVRGWLKLALVKGLTYEKIAALNLQQFRELFARQRKSNAKIVMPLWGDLLVESKRPGVTVQQLYEDYLKVAPDKPHLSRSSFYAKFHRIQENADPGLRRLCLHNSFRPSEVSMADYSGDTLAGKDSHGVPFVGQVFVGVLGYSGYIFCCVTPRQTREDWLSSISDMFNFFGGVSEELWLDNSTPLVRKPDRTDPVLAPEFKNFCDHFRTTGIAVAPREPTYKGLVENAVKQVQAFVLRPLSNRQFFTIKDMNKAVAIQLTELNNRPLTDRKGETRKSRYDQGEKRVLKKLPFIPYNLKTKIFERRVIDGDRIRIDNCRYAVPWGYVGREVLAVVNYETQNLKIFLKDTQELLGESRLRTLAEGDEPTRVDYVPDEFKTTVMNRDELVDLISKSYGTYATELAKRFARHSNSMARRHLRAMVTAAKKWETGEFEDICRITLAKPEVTYATFKQVCIEYEDSSKADKVPSDHKRKALPACKEAEIRGADYFSDGGENHDN